MTINGLVTYVSVYNILQSDVVKYCIKTCHLISSINGQHKGAFIMFDTVSGSVTYRLHLGSISGILRNLCLWSSVYGDGYCILALLSHLFKCCISLNAVYCENYTYGSRLVVFCSGWFCPYPSQLHRWNEKFIRMIALVVTGDVEGKLQRLRWRPGQSPWWPYCFCDWHCASEVTLKDMLW